MLVTHTLHGTAWYCMGCTNQRVMRDHGAFSCFQLLKSILSKFANRNLLFSLVSHAGNTHSTCVERSISSEQKKSVDPFPVSRKKCRSISSFDKKRHFLSIHFCWSCRPISCWCCRSISRSCVDPFHGLRDGRIILPPRCTACIPALQWQVRFSN
jgi:hypothetical protein